MSFTIIASPDHILPVSVQMPTLKDEVGGGSVDLRRRWTRGLRRWELMFRGTQEKLEQLSGFMDLTQGDTPFWFDGGGTIEVVEPILVGVGNGGQTDFALPHRYVFVSSAIIYLNGAATNAWSPIGGDGIEMDKIHFTSAPGNFAQIKARYRRKAKVTLDTESEYARNRIFRHQTNGAGTLYQARYVFQEVPN